MKIFYVAEFGLPNNSAYSLQVIKRCDSFMSLGYDNELIVPFSISQNFQKKLKLNYILKNHIVIKSIFKNKIKLNFIYRIIFSMCSYKYIYSRKEKKKFFNLY